MNKNKQTGFSLIELLVATALLLVILGPLLSFMRSAQSLRSTSYRLTDVEQNARAALVLIGRDLQNAGYNFPPSIDISNSTLLTPILGTGSTALTNIYPIIPGNNINLVQTENSSNSIVTNATDQITMVYTNQIFNNGLPLVGKINATGSQLTLEPGFELSDAQQSKLYPGDFCILNAGQEDAIGIVTSTSNSPQYRINFANGDAYNINRPGVGPLSTLDPQQTNRLITLYNFFFVTYFVDKNGNLIRRERLSPPHSSSNTGGPTSMNQAQVSVRADNNSKYDCVAGTKACYSDNIIATGVEDLQFTYSLIERPDPVNSNNPPLTVGPVDDPGFYGPSSSRGTRDTNYRLLDIRRVNVSIKVRAQERDSKVKDPYSNRMGYLYRFSLEGSFNTRNFYGSNYQPIEP